MACVLRRVHFVSGGKSLVQVDPSSCSDIGFRLARGGMRQHCNDTDQRLTMLDICQLTL
jgi:hypothetical protein